MGQIPGKLTTQPQEMSQWDSNDKLDLVTTHGGIDLDGSQRMLIAGFELGFDHWGTICPLG